MSYNLPPETGKPFSCDARSIQIKRQTKEMRVLSRAEQEKLCQYLYSNLDSCNIGILVCLFTGLRVGEICALRWEDVSFSDYTIHVHQTLQRIQDRTNSEYKTRIVVTTPKSACSIRTIPVPHGLMTILTAHKASSTGYILTNSISTEQIKQAMKKCILSKKDNLFELLGIIINDNYLY